MPKQSLGEIELNRIYQRDCIEGMRMIPDGSINVVLTSPPYNIGKEYEKKQLLEVYVYWMTQVIDECVRIINDNGSIVFQVGNYVNDGAVYPLDCILYPEFVKRGLIPRNRIVWTFGHGLHCTKRFSGRYETALWLTKTDDYTFNLDAVRIPQKYPNKRHYKGVKKGELSGNPLGKNPSDVWEILNVKHNHPEKTNHPCQFPLDFANRIILSLSNEDDVVLYPFMGSGTTAVGALMHKRKFIGFETERGYVEIANKRLDSLELPQS
ncbi:DNA-methyltransferase [Paenibacillus pinihumi]|uniref:DNA-methyltransferase n=1 Tax=Paenibacillus pinihumi TaxID=669462 RepID=UPI000404C89E|nr:site-specific DNA-methyltransferase [Paenibacillus pinihumi]